MKPPNYLLRPLHHVRRRMRRPPPGSSPGFILRQPQAEEVPSPRITVMAYGPEELEERELTDLGELRELRGRYPVLWVNVESVEHIETVRRLGEIFALHRLALEDVVNVPQRAKVEDYGDCLFIVARMTMLDEEGAETEQIGLFLGSDFVLSFQERAGDPLDPIRQRIRGRVGRIRAAGPDYLAYALLDTIVDHYFPVLEHFGDRLDDLEESILAGPTREVMAQLYSLKRDLTGIRRAIWPARDALNVLVRDPHAAIEDETRVYLRDTHDHVVQSIDVIESYRDLTSSLTDLYLSMVGHRTNEIMKVLTIFSAVFIPLTFIAGIYGMNFDPGASPFNMPELGWFWGYPFALAVMGLVAVLMLLFFYRRGWIGE